MRKCGNPFCGNPVPAHRKFCKKKCADAVRQRNFRDRHSVSKTTERRPQRHKDRKRTPAEAIAEAIVRLKKRPLLVQEKTPTRPAQAPPPSRELSEAILAQCEADRAKREEWKAVINHLLKMELSVRNLRSVYLSGMPFEAHVCRGGWPQWLREHPACLILDPGYSEFLVAYIESLYSTETLNCRHGVSWREECGLCEAQIDGDLSGADTKEANTVLAKLGLSVWAGKQPDYLTTSSADRRNDEGRRQSSHRKRPKGNAPDSFEPAGEKSALNAGQTSSRRDPKYAGRKRGLGRAANQPLSNYDTPSAQEDDRRLPDALNPERMFDPENPFDAEHR